MPSVQLQESIAKRLRTVTFAHSFDFLSVPFLHACMYIHDNCAGVFLQISMKEKYKTLKTAGNLNVHFSGVEDDIVLPKLVFIKARSQPVFLSSTSSFAVQQNSCSQGETNGYVPPSSCIYLSY